MVKKLISTCLERDVSHHVALNWELNSFILNIYIEWSDYSSWTSCDVTCGGTDKTRVTRNHVCDMLKCSSIIYPYSHAPGSVNPTKRRFLLLNATIAHMEGRQRHKDVVIFHVLVSIHKCKQVFYIPCVRTLLTPDKWFEVQ
jgi:hypothetical protein